MNYSGNANAARLPRCSDMACPICEKPTEPAYRPFCSRRCADVDLGRWMTGAYAIPAQEAEVPDPDAAPGAGGDGTAP